MTMCEEDGYKGMEYMRRDSILNFSASAIESHIWWEVSHVVEPMLSLHFCYHDYFF